MFISCAVDLLIVLLKIVNDKHYENYILVVSLQDCISIV